MPSNGCSILCRLDRAATASLAGVYRLGKSNSSATLSAAVNGCFYGKGRGVRDTLSLGLLGP